MTTLDSSLSSTTWSDAIANRVPARQSLAGRFVSLFDQLLQWQQRANDRRHMLGLNDNELQDIGVSRADIESEARKPFWQA